jgi:NAD(P)-dependent dehydrogenase (short-subunit alcohol dehydrogenase family)
MKRLSNKIALVTGGTVGIGRATAILFAQEGASVVLTGRRTKEGQDVVIEIKKSGGNAVFFKADVTKDEEVSGAVDFTVKAYGRLDIAFNNAGAELMCPLSEVTEEKYRSIFDVNVWGVLNSMKYETAAMLKSGGGAIVNNSSVFGHLGFPNSSIYIGSKHAVEGITKSAALEFAKQNIRINAVAPGGIATDMVDRLVGKEGAGRDMLVGLHPIGRLGKAEEIAAGVLYLASDEAKFVTGISLSIDGGLKSR